MGWDNKFGTFLRKGWDNGSGEVAQIQHFGQVCGASPSALEITSLAFLPFWIAFWWGLDPFSSPPEDRVGGPSAAWLGVAGAKVLELRERLRRGDPTSAQQRSRGGGPIHTIAYRPLGGITFHFQRTSQSPPHGGLDTWCQNLHGMQIVHHFEARKTCKIQKVLGSLDG